MAERTFVVVSGPPGSGKTTLAAPLAQRMNLPLLSKDVIKEALMDALGVETIEDSRRIGQAAIATLYAVATANGRAVLESNWSSPSTAELRNLGGRIVEVFCDVDPAVSWQRYVDRAADRHPGHFDRVRGDDRSLWHGAHPVDGGWPVLRVDTTVPVDLKDLVDSVRSALTRT